MLALGIAGVTTMFCVVNGVMLRGFSFPNSARLASLTFIDPTSAIGLFIGVGLTLGIATLGGAGIQNVLFGVTARDPLTYSVVVALITTVSLIATLVPAHRATRVDPMIALRAE